MIGADGYRRLVSTIRLDMLRLLGKSYIMEHIRAEVRRHQEAQLFRDYVADAIGQYLSIQPLYSGLAARHFPLLHTKEDTRTAEQITADNAKALAELCGGGETP